MIEKWRELGFSSSPDCYECCAKEYQCLRCKSKWESHTSPANWKYCPNCGVLWQNPGELVCQKKHRPSCLPIWPSELRPIWQLAKLNTYKMCWLMQDEFSGPAEYALRRLRDYERGDEPSIYRIFTMATKQLPLP